MYINVWNLDTRIDSRFRLYWSTNQLGTFEYFWNIKEDIRYRKTTDRSGGPKIGYYLFSLPAGVY